MKILVAENSNFIRKTIVDAISSITGIRAILESTSVSDALSGYSMFDPNVVILAYKLIGGNSMDLLEAIKAAGNKTMVIVIADSCSPQVRKQCLNEGAHHVLNVSKDIERITGILSDYSKDSNQAA
ncbi:MAG: response regulator [bacterium]